MSSNPRLSACAIALAAVVCASNAASAASMPFTGTLSIQIPGSPPMPATTVAGAGTAVVNGSDGGGHLNTLALPASAFDATHVVQPVTDPIAYPVAGFQLTVANQAGTVMGGSGPIPLAGTFKVCLFGPCSAAVANVGVPLAVMGAGGSTVVTNALANVTVWGAPWTTGTAAIGTFTQMGFAHGPASLASSTAAASGTVRLVTPIFITTTAPGLTSFGAFGVLTVHFVPEPTTLALLGGGLVLTAFAGRTRLPRD
jgi:hypothetical protein